jgi:hypothetical protein
MKEVSKKKLWKYNSVVKDLHSPKYRNRVKKPKEKYETNEKSIKDGLEEHLLNEEKS